METEASCFGGGASYVVMGISTDQLPSHLTVYSLGQEGGQGLWTPELAELRGKFRLN